MKFLLTGGGTAGPTTILLGLAKELKKNYDASEFLFLGDKNDHTEKLLVTAEIPYQVLRSGKWRRYFSIFNFTDLFVTLFAIVKAIKIIRGFKPDIILAAGSFVSVPVAIAGYLQKIPIFIHQQDVLVGLANKIIAPFATKITTAFESSVEDFPAEKTLWTGNPVRLDILHGKAERTQKLFKLKMGIPTILVMGGGTGAQRVNEIIAEVGPRLVELAEIIHITGKGKKTTWKHPLYHQVEFVTSELADIYAQATLVICRAGLGTSTELAALKKAAIMIPMPRSHQVDNVDGFLHHDAIETLDQDDLNLDDLVSLVQKLLKSPKRRKQLGENLFNVLQPLEANAKILHEIRMLIHNKIKPKN